MELITQVSKWPVRKIMAVIISGAVVGAISSVLDYSWADHPFGEYYEEIDQWVQMLVMSWSGYMVKERADNVTIDS